MRGEERKVTRLKRAESCVLCLLPSFSPSPSPSFEYKHIASCETHMWSGRYGNEIQKADPCLPDF